MGWTMVSFAWAAEPAPCEPRPGIGWASRIVSYAPGPGADAPYTNPANALGPPDFVEGANAVSLGNRADGAAELVVAFGDLVLVDGPGVDLTVAEAGPSVEATELAVSADGISWRVIGTIRGSTTDLDLAGKVPAGERYAFVRLRTAGRRATAAPWAGPDLDAVGLVHACAVRRALV